MRTGFPANESVFGKDQAAGQGGLVRQLFDAAPALIAIHEGPDHRYIYSNAAHDAAVGNRRLVGLTLREAMPELQGQGIFDRFDQVFRTGTASVQDEVPAQLHNPDEAETPTRWYRQILQAWYDAAGSICGVVSFAYDISEQVQARQLAQQRSAELDFALGAGGAVGTWDWDIVTDRLQVDARFARLFGVPPDEAAAGSPLERFVSAIHEADRARVTQAIEAALRSGEIFNQDYRVRSLEGEERWITARGRCFYGLDGQPVRFPGVVYDITPQMEMVQRLKASQAALHDSETRRRLAMEAGGVGTFDFFPQESRAVWDETVMALFGFTGEPNVPLDRIAESIHPDDRPAWQAQVGASLNPDGGGEHRVEMRVKNPATGSWRWVEARGRTQFEDGRATRMLGTVRDVTGRRQQEDELRLLNRELNHRVKNIFAVIQSLVRMSAGEADSREDLQASLLGRIDALAAAHLVGLQEEEARPLPLTQLLETVLAPYRQTAAAKQLAGEDLDLPRYLAAPLALVLHELATNAVKHGAWAYPDGRLLITWRVHADAAEQAALLTIRWEERAPEPVQPGDPAAPEGFGSRLIRACLLQLDGDIDQIWQDFGLTTEIRVPLAADPVAPDA